MLDSRSEKDNTCRSSHPQMVDRFKVPFEERQKLLAPVIQAFTVVFEAHVDEGGCSVPFSFLDGGCIIRGTERAQPAE